MAELTRAERFRKAREVYNRHGKQSLQTVYKETGVPASKIESLETDSDERKVGYQSIVTLAKHYGVSTDYLLGLSLEPTLNQTVQSVCKFTGLSSDTVEFLHWLSAEDYTDSFYRRLFDGIIQIGEEGLEDIPILLQKSAMAKNRADRFKERIDSKTVIENLKNSFEDSENGEYFVSAAEAEGFFFSRAHSKIVDSLYTVLEEMKGEYCIKLSSRALLPPGSISSIKLSEIPNELFQNEENHNAAAEKEQP